MTTLAQLMRSHYVALNSYLNDAVRTRGDFVRDFLGALVEWDYGDEFAGDTPLFRGETVSDSYLSDLFYTEKPKDWPKYVLRGMLNSHKKSFTAWLSEMSPDEWTRIKANMSKIGVKVESAEDLYEAVCASVKNELAEREKPAGEAPVEEKAEKKPEAEAAALHIVVRDGLGKTICPKNGQAAVQLYLTMADNPSAHPFLLLSVGESSAQLIMNRWTDGQHHLLLPQTVPAEMLVSREFYLMIAKICRSMEVIIHNTEQNGFFLKKLSEAMADPDDFVPFNDEKSILRFEVREVFGVSKEIFNRFEEAAAAWKRSPCWLGLTLFYENKAEALSVRKRLAFLGHWHFESVYQDAILLCDRNIKALLDEHSTGKRTFFGIN